MSDIRAFDRAARGLGVTASKEVPLIVDGTYTPTYLGGTTPGVTTYTTQQGAYKRIDSLVFVTGTLSWTNATGTGAVQVSLPFTSANVAGQNFALSIWMSAITFANVGVQALIQPNVAYFVLTSPATNAANANVNVEVAGNLVWSGVYLIA